MPPAELDLRVADRITLASLASFSLLSEMVMVEIFCFTSMVSPEFLRFVPRVVMPVADAISCAFLEKGSIARKVSKAPK